MYPDHQFQSSPPPSSSTFNFHYDHHRRHIGDSHRIPRKMLNPCVKTGEETNNKENEDEETGNLRVNNVIAPSTTTTTTTAAAACIITMPSCPASTTTTSYSSPPPLSTNLNGPLQSKGSKVFTSPFLSDADEFHAKNIGIVSALVVFYLIEVTVQVLFTIYSFQQQSIDVTANITELGTSSSSSSSPCWSWVLATSSVFSSLLVTLVSIIWVFQGMDFSGRLCGRLLCYVMHSFLFGLLWRYLKLAFAYDRVDLEEFFKLRTIQAYVQSLPLVTIHLAWILTTQQFVLPVTTLQQVDSYQAMLSWLVVVEILSAVISLLILSSPNESCTIANIHNNNSQQGIGETTRTSTVESTSPGDITSNRESSRGSLFGNSNKLKVESGKGDNNPNHHFNDSGTASSVDNQGSADDENDIDEEKSSCLSLGASCMTIAVKCMMSHYSQKCEPGRALLLVSRVISLGMLVYKMNYYWTGFITLLHLGVSFVWLGWWGIVCGGKSDRHIAARTPSSSSLTAKACREVNDSNDTCCDSRSDGNSSSNDSGLVVKSEALMEIGNAEENGTPQDACAIIIDDNNSEGHDNVIHNVNSGDSRAVHNGSSTGNQMASKTNSDRVNSQSSGLTSCFSILVQKNKPGNGMTLPKSNAPSQRKYYDQLHLLAHFLPLTYLLFWDRSNSSATCYFNGKQMSLNRLNGWTTAFLTILVFGENLFISVYYYISSVDEPNLKYLAICSMICLLFGYFLVAVYQFRGRGEKWRKSTHHEKSGIVHEHKAHYTRSDSVYKRNTGRNFAGSAGDTRANKKEAIECLSFCCSSLSHPLNIKRKARRDQHHQRKDADDDNFRKDSFNENLSPAEHQLQPCHTQKYNEYHEHQNLKSLMSAEFRHAKDVRRSKSNDGGNHLQGSCSRTSTLKSNRTTARTKILPHHHGIISGEITTRTGDSENDDSNDNYKSSGRPESVIMRKRGGDDDVHLKRLPDACTPPVPNNYTHVKEAVTRKISNKSCGDTSLKKPHFMQSNNRIKKDRESVKGDGEETEEGEAQVAISSFKSSSSTPRLHQQQQRRQQQHPLTTTNSNKCMPISIKSPISWFPETCCNDSSGSGESSNSRNTNTLAMPEPPTAAAITESRLFYCPEKYIDLSYNKGKAEETEEESKRTRRKQQEKQHHHLSQTPARVEKPDFSIVFFEGRAGGGTSRSYKQKQSRTPVASNALLHRAARSANTTPVASSKPFPMDIGPTPPTLAPGQLQHGNHPHLQPSFRSHFQQQYNVRCEDYDEDDEVDPIERATKEEGATHHRIRNQITGKTYLSDGASLTSLDGLCEIRASTPVEIKKASRVIVNYPPPHHQVTDSRTMSRCLCKVDRNSSPEGAKNNRKQQRCGMSPLVFSGCEEDHHPSHQPGLRACVNGNNNNNIYEKLIDDSYGILICEGENSLGQNPGSSSRNTGDSTIKNIDNNLLHPHKIVRLSEAVESRRTTGGASQKLKILCAKCLENHDPLLTNCVNPVSSVVDDDNIPEVIDYYTKPADIYNLVRMIGFQEEPNQQPISQRVSHSPYVHTPCDSDSTDYPSDTEFTVNNNLVEDDGQSLSTHFSSVTCTKQNHQSSYNYHHHQHSPYNRKDQEPKPTQLSQFIWAAATMLPTLRGCDDDGNGQQECPKEFTGLEYVRTWLMASHPRAFAINSSFHSNNTHQHPSSQLDQLPPPDHQQNEGGKRRGENCDSTNPPCGTTQQRDAQGINDKGLSLLSSTTSRGNHNSPFKNKSPCDKTISKKKRFRQIEKRQRPIGRGASPLAKELCTSSNSNADVFNGIVTTTSTTTGAPTTITNNTTTAAVRDDSGMDTTFARFQPPPSRKQHPFILCYDNMIPGQEEQKPQSATPHKKCRDQLDLFHKELETVV